MPSSLSRSSSKAGTIPAISRADCSRSSCTGMSKARRTCGEVFPTGCASCTFIPPVRLRSSTVTSGYWKPYATSHADLDADVAIQEEVRNAARTLLGGVRAKLEGKLVAAGEGLREPRQK